MTFGLCRSCSLRGCSSLFASGEGVGVGGGLVTFGLYR